MNLYLISQNANNGYDTFDSAVVCCESEGEASSIHPGGYGMVGEEEDNYGSWCKKSEVKVELIGEASLNMERGVVIASYNAG